MVNLDDSDTSFLVPCKRCAELLQEHERVCPFCGRDQLADEAPGQPATPGRGRPATDGASGLGAAQARSAFSTVAPNAASLDFASDGRPPEHRIGPAARPARRAIGVVAVLVGLILLFMALDPMHLRAPGGATTPEARPGTITSQPVRDPVAPVNAAAPSPPAAATAPVPAPAEPAASTTPPVREGCSEALQALSLCPTR